VTGTGQTSGLSAGTAFTVIGAPTVTGVSPKSGPLAGGTSVTITGTGFANPATVLFGGLPAAVTTLSAGKITATSPAGTGMVNVTVTTPGGTSAMSAADRFTYLAAPTVTGVSPSAGKTSGGTTVTISGSGFVTGATVSFGSAKATVTNVSPGSIKATAPAGTAGSVNVTVTTPGGTSATSAADRFTYL
jgi:hypothetical protein